jgi:hypothetical protein
MLNTDSIGRLILFTGIGIAFIGLLITFATQIPGLNRLGNLPGDIRYTSAGGSFGCFVPIVTSIVLSVGLTIVLNLVIRLLNK